MKHNFKTMALFVFVGLSMLAVGCQKENYVEQSNHVKQVCTQ